MPETKKEPLDRILYRDAIISPGYKLYEEAEHETIIPLIPGKYTIQTSTTREYVRTVWYTKKELDELVREFNEPSLLGAAKMASRLAGGE